jgi:NitT/TauT family transport system substrate-binding protein
MIAPMLKNRSPRRGVAAILAALGLLFGSWSAAAQGDAIRVGVLAFGTVNWELDVVRHHGLDRKRGVALEVVKLGSKNATAVALQAGEVNAIVTDWLWVSRQRAAGADYAFVPYSVAVGSIMVRPGAGVSSLADLEGKRIGIAGGPVDKSWLFLRAYVRKRHGFDPAEAAEPVFAAPPLLNQVMLRGEVDVALNFWHYAARLGAAGMTELVKVADLLPGLGVEGPLPLIGWVFSEGWAGRNEKLLQGFLDASAEAKKIMARSDAEWERLRPLTKAKDDAILFALRDAYRAGIPGPLDRRAVRAAEAAFATLAEVGGAALVGKARALSPGTFWRVTAD